ncbi:MAG: MarR family transcriptional regulator [Dehalococcoidales bacterium]|nr:MarR family transcriptional regulator [Dehalococcoidales bacterium]
MELKKNTGNKPRIDEDYRLWLLLAQTRSALFKAREKRLGQYIHHNQAMTLVFIEAHDGKATPSMISQMLSLEVQSVSGLVNRMEKKGLVIRTRDSERKNIIRLSLTEKGWETARQVRQLDFVKATMSQLSAEQQKHLRQCLLVLLDSALKELGIEDSFKLY